MLILMHPVRAGELYYQVYFPTTFIVDLSTFMSYQCRMLKILTFQ